MTHSSKKDIKNNQGYFKSVRTRAFGELLKENPKAFLLISAIGYYADRDGRGGYYGCKIGEAVVNCSCCGLTEQEYRTAKNHLIEKRLAAFEVRGKGKHKRTYARLLSTEIYDINLPDDQNTTIKNQYTNGGPTYKQNYLTNCKQTDYANNSEMDQPTINSQPTIQQHDTNDKQERKRKNKKEKNSSTTLGKNKFSQEDQQLIEGNETTLIFEPRYNVSVEKETHEIWLKRHGVDLVEKAYDLLCCHKRSKGKEHGDTPKDVASMHRWCIQAAQEELLKERELKARERKVQQMEKQAENPAAYWQEKNQDKIDFLIKLRNWLTEPLAIVQWNDKGVEVGRDRPDPLYKPFFIPFSHPDFQNAVINYLKKEEVFKGQGEWHYP